MIKVARQITVLAATTSSYHKVKHHFWTVPPSTFVALTQVRCCLRDLMVL